MTIQGREGMMPNEDEQKRPQDVNPPRDQPYPDQGLDQELDPTDTEADQLDSEDDDEEEGTNPDTPGRE
ncbi:hypothetical protein [Aminobacter sp. DSM 101952]|uniref:hypothetical protein n=1 Tax=Aminobacter sp. DSM 101952 TaxID=2735891 RepID=UPI0009EA10DE|nr:hypothetical protein [Aminobacter sp. DSM 101952]